MNIMFTHSDLDGIGCGLVGKICGMDLIKFCSYADGSKYSFEQVIENTMKEYGEVTDTVALTDVGISQDMWARIHKSIPESAYVVVYDHHDTTRDMIVKFPARVNACYCKDKCACKSMYEDLAFETPELTEYGFLIDAINSYDCWTFTNPVSKNLQRIYDWCVFQNPRDKFKRFDSKVQTFLEYLYQFPIQEDLIYPMWMKSCLSMYQRNVAPKVKSIVKDLVFEDSLCICDVLSEDNIPMFEISWYIEDNKPEIEDMVYIIRNKYRRNATFSIRSKSNKHNLSKIAEIFGGGGHEEAASFTVSLHNVDVVMKKLRSLLV